MKKALLIISILSIIFLTGCGIFNLNGWVWPDDLEFITMVESLDTPEKIAEYMQDNFTYEAYPIYAPDPYTLWKNKKGDCNDFSTFGVFIAHWHGYGTYQIKIFYKGKLWRHYITVYVEDDGLSFTDNQYYNLYLPNDYRFNDFKEIVEYDGTLRAIGWPVWSKYIVYDYKNNIVEKEYSYVH